MQTTSPRSLAALGLESLSREGLSQFCLAGAPGTVTVRFSGLPWSSAYVRFAMAALR
jgi:hypothetical protein